MGKREKNGLAQHLEGEGEKKGISYFQQRAEIRSYILRIIRVE